MNKNLAIVSQNNQLMLKKSKSLMAITNNILSNDDWMQRLWDWADENQIPDLYEEHKTSKIKRGLARNKEELLNSTYLWLTDNKLTKFTNEIDKLTNLSYLFLDNNKFHNLPKEICNLVNLSGLYLAGNEIEKLPDEIGDLSNLTKLYLHSNKLTKLPDSIVNLTNLVELHIEDNPSLTRNKKQKEWIFHILDNNDCDFTANENIYHSMLCHNDILNDDKQKIFNKLIQKIYNRDYILGDCFERNIIFESFEDNKVTWRSIASGEDKKMLFSYWGLINMYVKDIFGFETKIINLSQKQEREEEI